MTGLRRRAIVVAILALTTAGCSSSADRASVPAPLRERVDAIAAAVERWSSAPDLAQAKAAAEEAANLVTGPAVTGYGDRDGDGDVRGRADAGLLPGEDGSGGLARQAAGDCLRADVLGGSWSDPGGRWSQVRDAIAQWRADNNTFPSLASHPQRIVGWAALTLAATTLDEAHEYGGHATLHAEVTSEALSRC